MQEKPSFRTILATIFRLYAMTKEHFVWGALHMVGWVRNRGRRAGHPPVRRPTPACRHCPRPSKGCADTAAGRSHLEPRFGVRGACARGFGSIDAKPDLCRRCFCTSSSQRLIVKEKKLSPESSAFTAHSPPGVRTPDGAELG